jgi:hypothetical protein
MTRMTTHAFFAPGTAILVGAVRCAEGRDPDALARAAGIVGERRGSVQLRTAPWSPQTQTIADRSAARVRAARALPQPTDAWTASDHRWLAHELARECAAAEASVAPIYGPELEWALEVSP